MFATRASVIARILCGPGEAVVRFRPSRKMRGEWSARRRTSLPSCRTSCDVRAPPGAPLRRFLSRGPRFLGRGKRASPSPASSSQSGHNAARSGPRASRARGCEPRPRAPPHLNRLPGQAGERSSGAHLRATSPPLPRFRIASRSVPSVGRL